MGLVQTSFIVGIIAVVVFWISNQFYLHPHNFRTPGQLNPQYDYIIVGGGSAGSILASRLSEDPQTSVLLLEAGPEHTLGKCLYCHIPGAASMPQLTDLDWNYRTEPQENACQSMLGKRCRWPRGKILGGTGVFHSMIHVRGNSKDFDRWAADGIKGWSYQDVLPFFKKSEAVTIKGLDKVDWRGHAGPLTIEPTYPTPLGLAIMESAKESGFTENEDYNGFTQEGFSWLQLTIKKGRRQSSASAYLEPALKRNNLHVVPQALATKIILNERKEATAVEYMHENRTHRVLTNREIIVSAGTVESPHLLMLSGLGPRAKLDKFAIPIVVDLPAVGENLADHVLVHLEFGANQSSGYPGRELLHTTFGLKALFDYAILNKGPLTRHAFELTGFASSGLEPDPRVPDLQFLIGTSSIFKRPEMINLSPEVFNQTFAQGANFPASASFIGILNHPRSRGSVSLNSPDPTVKPLIDPRYLTDERDANALVIALQELIAISESDPLKKYDFKLADKPITPCAHLDHMSKDYLKCFVRQVTISVSHATGSCRMGVEPSNSVVDSELRVHGVKNLRVVDASVIPHTVSGNINAVVSMVAEKAATLFKK